MSQYQAEMLSQKDKIQILLQEYSTLRAELVSRGNFSFQIAALVGVFLTFMLTRPIDRRFWIAALIGLIGLFGLVLVVVRDLRKIARRVKELETDINKRAGEELLVWESRWGATVTGFVFLRPPLPPKSDLPETTK